MDSHEIVTDDVVRLAYKLLLGRDVESQRTLDTYRRMRSVDALRDAIITSIEYRRKTYHNNNSRFWGINTQLDFVDLILRHAAQERERIPGHIVNFLGVAMNVDFMPMLKLAPGSFDPPPIPANYHADMAEWAAMLRAVDLAKETFTCIELGCGWGACLNSAGAAARRKGLKTFLIGVEGDESYIEFAKQALTTNSFVPQNYSILRGIAAGKNGTAFFPKQNVAGSHWGLKPVFVEAESERASLASSGHYDELPMIALADIIADRDRIDLLHMDIQGGERELVRDCIDVMSQKVAYCFVGTHSRPIEGEVMTHFLDAGWILEIERPLVFNIHDGKPVTRIDGAQGWRNPRLLP